MREDERARKRLKQILKRLQSTRLELVELGESLPGAVRESCFRAASRVDEGEDAVVSALGDEDEPEPPDGDEEPEPAFLRAA
jgi:hypothetical protein